MRNNRKITRYIERIARIHDEQSGDLNVADVTPAVGPFNLP